MLYYSIGSCHGNSFTDFVVSFLQWSILKWTKRQNALSYPLNPPVCNHFPVKDIDIYLLHIFISCHDSFQLAILFFINPYGITYTVTNVYCMTLCSHDHKWRHSKCVLMEVCQLTFRGTSNWSLNSWISACCTWIVALFSLTTSSFYLHSSSLATNGRWISLITISFSLKLHPNLLQPLAVLPPPLSNPCLSAFIVLSAFTLFGWHLPAKLLNRSSNRVTCQEEWLVMS